MEFRGAKVDWIQSSDARMPTTEVASVAALRLHLLNIVSRGHQVFSSPELQNVEPRGGAPFMNEGLSNLHHDRKCTLTHRWVGLLFQLKPFTPKFLRLQLTPICHFIIHTPWGQNQEEKPKEMGRGKCLLPRAWCLFFLFIGLKRAAKFWCHSSNLRAW